MFDTIEELWTTHLLLVCLGDNLEAKELGKVNHFDVVGVGVWKLQRMS